MSQSNTEQSDNAPRCSNCGQPLVSWDQHHDIEDCERWLDETEGVRQIIERNVAEARS